MNRRLAMTILAAPAVFATACSAEPENAWRWNAKGDQVYTCKPDGDRLAWTLLQPDAVLMDADGRQQGTHGAGPSWRSNDGSAVFGAVVATIPAPRPGAVAWLVLRAARHDGAGRMAAVAFVIRTDTDDGAAPSTPCIAGHELRVPYTATYIFVPERPHA